MSKSSKNSSKGAAGGAKGKAAPAAASVPAAALKDRGPLLISLGPQCAGKTTLIAGLGENNLQDIAIDDAPAVYERVPASFLVSLLEPKAPGFEKPPPYADKKAFGKSVIARALDAKETEIGILFSLFVGAISYEAAEARLLLVQSPSELISAVKALKEANATFSSKTVDFFIPEAIPAGVQQYKDRLESAAKSNQGCVVSGNCNVKTEDYATALNTAFNNRRRVRFLRWGAELLTVPLSELYRRSVARFLSTGRYVPSSSIALALQQATAILAAGSSHAALAAAAGFTLTGEGYVYPSSTVESEVPAFADVTDSKWAAWFSGDEIVVNLKTGQPVPAPAAAPALAPVSAPAAPAPARAPAPTPTPAPAPAPALAPAPAPAPAPKAAAPPAANKPASHPASSATEMLKAAISKIESETADSPLPQPAPAAGPKAKDGKAAKKEAAKTKDAPPADKPDAPPATHAAGPSAHLPDGPATPQPEREGLFACVACSIQ